MQHENILDTYIHLKGPTTRKRLIGEFHKQFDEGNNLFYSRMTRLEGIVSEVEVNAHAKAVECLWLKEASAKDDHFSPDLLENIGVYFMIYPFNEIETVTHPKVKKSWFHEGDHLQVVGGHFRDRKGCMYMGRYSAGGFGVLVEPTILNATTDVLYKFGSKRR